MLRLPRNRHRLALCGLAALVLSAAVASTACQREATPSAQDAPVNRAEIRTVTVPVSGMICMVCAGNVKNTLQAVQGVRKADVDLAKHNVTVEYEQGEVSVEALTRAINELGYKAGVPTPAQSQ